jgi:cell division septal protein FtsQ
MKLFNRAKGNRRLEAGKPRLTWRGLRVAALRVLGVTSTVGLALGGWYWVTRSDTFAVRTIGVEGTSPERAEEIRALLAVTPGKTSLLFLDLADVRSRVEGHPWVASALVKRELPDALTIVVTEREPKLILALDRLYYLDDSGTPFKALSPGDRYDLPVLSGIRREEVVSHSLAARDAILGGLALADALSQKSAQGALTLDEVSEITWDEHRGYTAVTLKGNERVRFGIGDWKEKLSRLKEVREQRKGLAAEARTIDLTFASRVVVAR